MEKDFWAILKSYLTQLRESIENETNKNNKVSKSNAILTVMENINNNVLSSLKDDLQKIVNDAHEPIDSAVKENTPLIENAEKKLYSELNDLLQSFANDYSECYENINDKMSSYEEQLALYKKQTTSSEVKEKIKEVQTYVDYYKDVLSAYKKQGYVYFINKNNFKEIIKPIVNNNSDILNEIFGNGINVNYALYTINLSSNYYKNKIESIKNYYKQFYSKIENAQNNSVDRFFDKNGNLVISKFFEKDFCHWTDSNSDEYKNYIKSDSDEYDIVIPFDDDIFGYYSSNNTKAAELIYDTKSDSDGNITSITLSKAFIGDSEINCNDFENKKTYKDFKYNNASVKYSLIDVLLLYCVLYKALYRETLRIEKNIELYNNGIINPENENSLYFKLDQIRYTYKEAKDNPNLLNMSVEKYVEANWSLIFNKTKELDFWNINTDENSEKLKSFSDFLKKAVMDMLEDNKDSLEELSFFSDNSNLFRNISTVSFKSQVENVLYENFNKRDGCYKFKFEYLDAFKENTGKFQTNQTSVLNLIAKQIADMKNKKNMFYINYVLYGLENNKWNEGYDLIISSTNKNIYSWRKMSNIKKLASDNVDKSALDSNFENYLLGVFNG